MSEVSAFIVAIAMICCVASVIWWIIAAVTKKNIKIPFRVGITCVAVVVVFTIIGTISWTKTDDYQEYLAEKAAEDAKKEEQEREEEENRLKEQEEQRNTEKQENVAEMETENSSYILKNAETQITEQEKGKETVENTEELNSETEKTQIENADSEIEDKFVLDLKEVIDSEVAEKTYDILKNQIGFSDLEYEGQIDATSNYEIIADGHYMVVTVSDDVYRVFIPNSSYTFYQDGNVTMTASELENKTIDQNDMYSYYIMAQEIVENCLKNPKSADFPSIVTHPEEIAMQRNGDIVAVQSYVDATNSFGATVRSKWMVEFKVLDLETYSYEALYINMDGETSGEYVELD